MVQHNKKLQVQNSKQNEILIHHQQYRPQIPCVGAHNQIISETLQKALRTQVLTALTSNFGSVGLGQYAW